MALMVVKTKHDFFPRIYRIKDINPSNEPIDISSVAGFHYALSDLVSYKYEIYKNQTSEKDAQEALFVANEWMQAVTIANLIYTYAIGEFTEPRIQELITDSLSYTVLRYLVYRTSFLKNKDHARNYSTGMSWGTLFSCPCNLEPDILKALSEDFHELVAERLPILQSLVKDDLAADKDFPSLKKTINDTYGRTITIDESKKKLSKVSSSELKSFGTIWKSTWQDHIHNAALPKFVMKYISSGAYSRMMPADN